MASRSAARSGMALILTLAVLVLAAGLALYLQARAAGLSRAEKADLLRERLRIAAAEAAREALWTLAADENLAVDHLGEDWALPREADYEDGLSTRAIVEDAGRFYNWNNLGAPSRASRSPADILFDLMTFCGDFAPLPRIDALADFLDADDEGPYEAAFYRRMDPPYEPPNRLLWAPAELLRVHGFSEEYLAPRSRMRPGDLFDGNLAAATVIVPAAIQAPIPVNVNTASREVLTAVAGLENEIMVRYVLAQRLEQPVDSLAVIFAAYPELAAALEGAIGTASTYFRVRARASLGVQSRSVTAWVERDSASGDIRILQWIEEEG